MSLRIVVIGSSCAGKSTLAEALARERGCPCIDLDELYWAPAWTPKPPMEFLRLVEDAAAGEAWVAAGNFSTARPALWARATTIVWLDYSLPVVMWRGLRRTLARIVGRTVLFHGNRESLRRAFLSRESLLLWIVTTYHRRRRDFARMRNSGEFGHLTWLQARRPADLAAIRRSLQQEG